mgnify:CR=1 FL=1
MIAIDTSAIIAILEAEEDAAHYIAALEEDDAPLLSAATFVELNAVMKHKGGQAALNIVDRFIELANITIEPFTADQALIAREAYFRFSVLNLGDAYSYALAKQKGIPLLFKGKDFFETDIMPYIPSS